MNYRGKPKTSQTRIRHGSVGGRSHSKGKQSDYDNRNFGVPEFVKADFEDESATVPEYLEQADMLEQAGFQEDAMYLRMIAMQEASHRDFFAQLKKKINIA